MLVRRTLLAAALAAAPNVAAAGERWPSWPSEVERVAGPLKPTDRPSHDAERAAALIRLEAYATPVIEPYVLDSLSDPSSHVRREALRICYLRRIDACIEPATAIYGDKVEPTLKAAALRVVALDPQGKRLGILLDALRDNSDPLRAQAAQLVGWAALTETDRSEARRALIAKLSDTASSVRARAVESVGLLGPGEGTLAVARLLEDPEPVVRASAAKALGRMRDGAAVPGLIRALAGQNEPLVFRALIAALARLPGDKAAEELLRRLDTPPTGTGHVQVAEAIGDRPNPEPLLLAGLIERLDEPALRLAVERALLMMGRTALGVLEETAKKGLEPGLSARVGRLIAAARSRAQKPLPRAAPLAPSDRAAWGERLTRGDERARLHSAAQLGVLSPAWLWGRVRQRNFSEATPQQLRPWMVAMAVSSGAPWKNADVGALLWARLIGLAHDPTQSDSDRCLALLALVAGRTTTARRELAAVAASLIDDPHPPIRACAAMSGSSLGRPEVAFEGLLDADDRVRAASLLALGTATDVPPDVQARIALAAATDRSAPVRAAATWALESHEPAAPGFVAIAAPQASWARPDRFIEATLGADQRIWIPAVYAGRLRWGIGPALEGAAAEVALDGPL